VTDSPSAQLAAVAPLAGLIGIEVDAAEPGEVRARMAWREELCTVGGLLHGGAIMAFADTLGGLCTFLNLKSGETTATVESKTNFFRGVREGHVHGTTRPLHVGRSFVVVQTDVRDDTGRHIAQVTQTQAVLQPRG
jgi:uncharacterized protein (TIGR00369 family)